MCGSATLTMAVSSTTISCAAAITNSARPSRPPPAAAAALDRIDRMTDMTDFPSLGAVIRSGAPRSGRGRDRGPGSAARAGRLISDHPGDDGVGARGGDPQPVKPGGPVLAQDTFDPDLVTRGYGRHLCRPTVGDADIGHVTNSGPGGRHTEVEERVESSAAARGHRWHGSLKPRPPACGPRRRR